MKRCLILWFLVLLVAHVAVAQRPDPDVPLLDQDSQEGPSIKTKWSTFVRDTSLTESFKLASQQDFTQMAVADSLRLISTNANDKPKVRLVFVSDSTSDRRSILVTLNGTDSTFVRDQHKARFLEAAYPDSECAGTVTIKRKTGGNIVQLAPNDMAAAPAHHFFGNNGGGLYGWDVLADPESPTLHLQLRLYRDHLDAVHTPETGYVLLDEMFVGGTAVYHPQNAKNIIASNDDTSVVFSIVGAEKVGFLSVVKPNGTVNQAFHLDVSPDRTNFKHAVGLDSLNATGVTTNRVLAADVPLANIYGAPWARVRVDGKAGAGDTTKTDTYMVVNRGSETASGWQTKNFLTPEKCPALSYVAVYARAFGAHGRVYLRLRGYDR